MQESKVSEDLFSFVGMGFKKREYNSWKKILKEALYSMGSCPYWFKRYWDEVFLEDEDYEGMKAVNDVFNEWYELFKMSESEVNERIQKRIKEIYH